MPGLKKDISSPVISITLHQSQTPNQMQGGQIELVASLVIADAKGFLWAFMD